MRALVDRFYDLMDLEPDFAGLRALHPTTLDGSRDKFAWFLTGWLGGPDLYVERFGHPRLRARHLPYPIGVDVRDQWLTCMGLAMAEIGEAGGFTADMQSAPDGLVRQHRRPHAQRRRLNERTLFRFIHFGSVRNPHATRKSPDVEHQDFLTARAIVI